MTVSIPNNLTGAQGPYQVYAAGEMFNLHDLATNVQLKEEVWELSRGNYELNLPQSKEPRDIDHPNLAAHIRNLDLRSVMCADILLARFDGLELDSGTVVEYMFARFLGKPAVILRADNRRSGEDHFDEPFNLMAKNWPRTVQVHVNALMSYMGFLAAARAQSNAPVGEDLREAAEQEAVRQGTLEIARKVIEGLDAVRQMESPYPPEHRERAYMLARLSPGSGFEALMPEAEVDALVARLRARGVL